MKTIVIDPGHGGYDYGAGDGVRYEKDDNLRLGLALAARLRRDGYNVVLTRSTDIFVPLIDRSVISNTNNADLFISLHRNWAASPSANGVENFVQSGSPQTNAVYAWNVLSRLAGAGVQNTRGVSYDNFSVLRNTWAPAQLLESGFVTNAVDNMLFDRNFDAYVDAIANGIAESVGPPDQGNGGADANIIRGIQRTLNNRYGASLAPDGVYGPATKRGIVRGLQTELNRLYGANLIADGVFGPATRRAVRLLRRGDRSNLVYLLQAALYGAGYYLTPDGDFGPATETAVKSFQAADGLTPDGVAGRDTFSALFGAGGGSGSGDADGGNDSGNTDGGNDSGDGNGSGDADGGSGSGDGNNNVGNADIIRGIQRTLNNRYGTALAADGIYDPATERGVVRGLQTELNRLYGANVAADGVWGPATRLAVRPLKRGNRNNLVYLLQAALYGEGYYLTPDGIFGAATEAAVKSFQAANGLTADGIAGRDTFSVVFR
ncbi:MAG: peptidoglycan-binding protein [Clostridiales bacterium]|jgi:peptidoglycan hydrolase-like protein with peptidoglycan-binding domain|nr:peptidoglycan-binding protein [Clostridiales bacterium]